MTKINQRIRNANVQKGKLVPLEHRSLKDIMHVLIFLKVCSLKDHSLYLYSKDPIKHVTRLTIFQVFFPVGLHLIEPARLI